MKNFVGFIFLSLIIYAPAYSADLFFKGEEVQGGLSVYEVSNVFSDIYENLDSVKFGGKTINVAIESLEKIHPSAHIAATDERVVLVWDDNIVANYPRPASGDFDSFGQITTALVIKLRALIPEFGAETESQMYQRVVGALMRGLDENGRYIYSKKAEIFDDGRILTSVGLDGELDDRGNFRVSNVYKGSSADNSGIKPGDLITKINGVATADMSAIDIKSVMSGFNSGTLKLMLVSPTGATPVVLRRATIVLADADIINRTGSEFEITEIVIHRISDNAVSVVSQALANHPNTMGIILDLRNARGDDERSAAKLAGLFIGRVPVMRITETAKSEIEIIPGSDARTFAPMVVLVSNTTSGTAEAIAAAFHENKRAVLVGTPTSGNARIATKIDLKNGGALELMNKSIKTGAGKILDKRGVFPLVCLSNIRTDEQRGAFFVNIFNNDFNARDFNSDLSISRDVIVAGCPQITSGADEDTLAAAMSVKILTDIKIYNKLINQ